MKYYKNGSLTYGLIGKKLVNVITEEECYDLRDEYPFICVGSCFEHSWVNDRDIIYLYSPFMETYYYFCKTPSDHSFVSVLVSLS